MHIAWRLVSANMYTCIDQKCVQVSTGILNQTILSMRAVMAPKLDAIEHLAGPCSALPLDFCLSFSSVSSIAGFSGHANYCAANAALDVYAEHGAACGLPMLAVQWGAWSAIGKISHTKRLHK